MLERAAADWPELAALWFRGARGRVHAQLAEYLDRRTDPFPAPGDPHVVAAATIVDLIHAYMM